MIESLNAVELQVLRIWIKDNVLVACFVDRHEDCKRRGQKRLRRSSDITCLCWCHPDPHPAPNNYGIDLGGRVIRTCHDVAVWWLRT